ncbi:MAG: tRNA (guanosine(37)-N1)-methyltransferase TrmD [Gemmatimonadetes bacterium]|nr:tRNA (guanosine(37)-N1)-methyltransferase TrmD [Gemmatimonadota bacterium]NIO33081.1 tRNA (guanosine(37)-N1)-methyltransferase TrmD [Gemmatimonadota bacterium]
MRINILTIFPGFFREALTLGIPGRAARDGLVSYSTVDLRDYTHDRHRTVDDEPYGGGAGMVMKPEPFFEAIDALKPQGPIVLLDARGRIFRHEHAVRISLEPELTLLCGHYKDVDWRVAEGLATDVFSLGDFVLSGGEPAALCLVDAVVRLLPGSLGDHESASSDSFYDAPLLAPPTYTRPPEYRGMEVPEVLRSGDHAAISDWRRKEAERLTRELRPDLADR